MVKKESNYRYIPDFFISGPRPFKCNLPCVYYAYNLLIILRSFALCVCIAAQGLDIGLNSFLKKHSYFNAPVFCTVVHSTKLRYGM